MKIKITSVIFVFFVSCLISSGAFAQLQKSPNDHREYRSFELENRLTVLVISDPKTERSAASMSVQVGGGDDPQDRLGMAHYLEHMLFLGTEKYPELDEYRAFIEQNGGSTNAYTAIDLTNYRFEIEPDFLKPTLDRFAQFFIAPLFPEEQIGRERTVVHAEFEMRTQRDGVRRWAAMRQAYNPKHPSAKFVSGTAETLAGHIRPDLIRFFEQHYSANLMNLVVVGREPLDQLQNWVEELFSDIKDVDASPLQVNEPLFEDGSLPALLQYRTLKNEPKLTLMFPVQNLRLYWKESPSNYIGNILGHEGKGSLFSDLKAQGWANGLYVGSGNTGLNTHTVSVVISLTEDGLSNWRNAAAYVFQYIREISDRGIAKWRFDEQQLINEIEFRFAEIDSSGDYVTVLADALHFYPSNEVLAALYLVQKYDPELIADVLSRMRQDSVLVILASPSAETNQTTPYLGTEYSLSPIPEQAIDLWSTDIADASDWLPERNDFLPQNFELVSTGEMSKPERIISQPGFELWHHKDVSFDVPKANFYFSVRSPLKQSSIRNTVLLDLFVDAVNDQLSEYSYPALLAGLNYSLYAHSRGFSTKVSGYSEKQSVLLERIIEVLKNPKFSADRFEINRNKRVRAVQNRLRDSAYRQAFSELYSIIVEPNWTDAEELATLKSVSLEDLNEFFHKLFDETHVVALSHGNVRQQEAIALANLVSSELLESTKPAEVNKNRVLNLLDSGPYFRHLGIENSDSSIVVYLQGEDKSLEERARFALFAQTLQTEFFSKLRSVQQLGYVVFSTYMPVGQVPGVSFVIQSPDVEPQDMDAAINGFLDSFHEWLTDMPDEEFEGYKEGLIALIQRKESTLTERSERHWLAIDEKDTDFDRNDRVAAIVNSMERASFEDFVLELLNDRRDGRLVILGYGSNIGVPQTPNVETGIAISDVMDFKRKSEFFPHS